MRHYKGLSVLIEKEFAEHLRSKRFYLILTLILIIGLSSVYSAASGMSSSSTSSDTDFFFLNLFSSSGENLPSFATFISFFLPLIGLTLGFDVINGETSKGTLSRLMAQPIYRDSIIIGKFIGGTAVLALMSFVLFTVVIGLGIIMIGTGPYGEEILRIFVYLIITILYVSFWYGLSLMLSMLLKQTTASALAGIALWLFFTIFLSLIVEMIANNMFTINNTTDTTQILHYEEFILYGSRLSPMQLYSEAITTMLNPSVRSLGIVFSEQLNGAVVGSLPFGESLMLIWPHIVSFIGLIAVIFGITYITFMKREIRSN